MQRLQDSRIDLVELKEHIVKKIGVEKSRKYFYYLSRFLSQKLTKSEFDKLCYRLLGRENFALHNKLIRSILQNASLAKSPPPVHKTGHLEKSLVHGKVDGPEQRGSLIPNHNLACSNGVLPISPRKVRSGVRERIIRDRPSPLGPNGKVESLLHQVVCREDKRGDISMENGDLGPLSYQRSGRYADERDGLGLGPNEKTRIPDQVTTLVSRDTESEDEQAKLILSRQPLVAPLGIPFCSASIGGSHRTLPLSLKTDINSCYESGELLGTESLRKRMENIAVAQGLEGVSPECSSVLNNMLEMYLKKLIKSCVDLAGSRSTNGATGKQTSSTHQSQNKIVNGVWPSNSLLIQNTNQPSDIPQTQHSVSLLDFRVAMELNPQQLGEDWPLLRERISIRSFDEQDLV